MALAGWFTIIVILLCLSALIFTSWSADLIMIAGLTILMVAGAVDPSDALVGFSNQGMLTVAALYVVASGLRETGAIHLVISKIMGRPNKIGMAQLRVMGPVTVLSALMNNTPVVASFIPAIQDWAHKHRISASKLMIPLSYAAILGGACTLIGTSTNLVVNGMLLDQPGARGLGIFEPAWIGVPVAIIGFIYLLIFGRRLLPDRKAVFDSFQNPREYTIEMIVKPGGGMEGMTIEEAGLRHLPGLFLVEIYRNDRVIAAVSPREKLQANDRLIFAGIVESIVDLQQFKGLDPATDQVFKLDSPRRNRRMIEAVISPTHPLNGKTIREGRFRNKYNAVVLAVTRNGERLKKKVGDIELKTGDTLLIEAHPSFVEQTKNSKDYLLVSSISNSRIPNYDKAGYAWAILLGMVTLAATHVLSMFMASILAAGSMLALRVVSASEARQSIDLTVLLVIAASIGLGKSLQVTGAAEVIAMEVMKVASTQPYLALAATYLLTWLMTEMITNNAAAVLIFPIAYSVAGSMGVSYMPFIMVILIAASASFSTPIGYQTNLMVYGPGGYKFTDYTRIGLPLNLMVGTVAVLLIPIIWPF